MIAGNITFLSPGEGEATAAGLCRGPKLHGSGAVLKNKKGSNERLASSSKNSLERNRHSKLLAGAKERDV